MTLKELFPDGRFNVPATIEDIKYAENELGVKLPKQLIDLYLETNGFRENLGNAAYLLPLKDTKYSSLVDLTKVHWTEISLTNYNVKDFIFFGSSTNDQCWAINFKNEKEIIAYHHHMEGEAEFAGENIMEIYKKDYKRFEKLK